MTKNKGETIKEWLCNKTGLSFWDDYSNLIRPARYNWVNFTWVNLSMEWDKMDNSFSIEVGVMGFNMRWQLPLPGTTKQKDEIMKRLKEIKLK